MNHSDLSKDAIQRRMDADDIGFVEAVRRLAVERGYYPTPENMSKVITVVETQPIEAEDPRIERAYKLLPAWFVPRMMGDVWSFALLTADRVLIAIDSITEVHQAADGSIWLDVDLMLGDAWTEDLRERGYVVLTAPTERTKASINASHIVAAFEIADT